MEIKFIKNNTFVIKGKKEDVLVNPEGKISEKDARIIIFNKHAYGELRREDERVAIMGPGEYEVGGVEINGYATNGGNTMYTVTIDKVTVGVLGKLTENLSDKKAEKITGVDALVVEISDGAKTGYKEVMQLAKNWGANYVIPVGYSEGNEDIAAFLNETDNENLEPVDTLKIDKDSLPDGTEVVRLKELK